MDNELNSSSKFSNNAHVNKADRDQIIDTCLIAGRIMVEVVRKLIVLKILCDELLKMLAFLIVLYLQHQREYLWR